METSRGKRAKYFEITEYPGFDFARAGTRDRRTIRQHGRMNKVGFFARQPNIEASLLGVP